MTQPKADSQNSARASAYAEFTGNRIRPTAPSANCPKHDGPSGDGPKHDGPKHDGPKHDGPKHDGPKHDGPKGDGPKGDARAITATIRQLQSCGPDNAAPIRQSGRRSKNSV